MVDGSEYIKQTHIILLAMGKFEAVESCSNHSTNISKYLKLCVQSGYYTNSMATLF
jgi:hypothetical protein